MKRNDRGASVRRRIVELAGTERHGTVRDLYLSVSQSDESLSEDEFVQEVMSLASDGTVSLAENIRSDISFLKFLRLWHANLWLYLVAGFSVLTLIAVSLPHSEYPFIAIRWVIGSVFVLILPGYVTTQILFPKKDLDHFERFLMSVGLSLALVSLFGLMLNFSPWGIRLGPILTSLFAYTIAIGLGASLRRFHSIVQTG